VGTTLPADAVPFQDQVLTHPLNGTHAVCTGILNFWILQVSLSCDGCSPSRRFDPYGNRSVELCGRSIFESSSHGQSEPRTRFRISIFSER
jgi:hypothetical protein